MDTSTTIRGMISDSYIFVPNYQRAYSWDTDVKSNPKQVNQFLIDLENHILSATSSKYYLGHFLFEESSNEDNYGVIDGQQRLTTIVIFVSALFKVLKSRREISSSEEKIYNKLIRERDGICHFKTVDYDNQFFLDYVIEQNTVNPILKTESQRRIKEAFDFFCKELNVKTEDELLKLLDVIQSASCSTYVIARESDAIQMFIFQNDRGKKPTNLEKVKAQFMFHVHLYAKNDTQKNQLLEEIKNRFENIYMAIESIGRKRKISEDSILNYTAKVYFNKLPDFDVEKSIHEELKKTNCVDFIKVFTQRLSDSFDYISRFIADDSVYIKSLVVLGYYSVTLPFVIKAYSFNLCQEDFKELCIALETILVRDSVIRTRADLVRRLEDVFGSFNGSIKEIVNRINWMKEQYVYPWFYWNNYEFKNALQGYVEPSVAKYLLWKYENHLIEEEGKAGYAPIRYDSIENAQLEHIAPQNPSGNPIENGYCEYDEEFRNQYLDCLGNYLLLSGFHNDSISNGAFEKKRETYNQLRQQIEVQQMTEADRRWDKEKINERKKKIVDFILKTF